MRLLKAIWSVLIGNSRIYQYLKNRMNFPGLNIDYHANIQSKGDFVYSPGVSIGKHSHVHIFQGGSLFLGDNCFLGTGIELGTDRKMIIHEGTSIQNRCILLGNVLIGRYCTFAPNVYISSGNHYFRLFPEWYIRDQDQYVLENEELYKSHHKPVVVEDDCWLGINVAVMPGVTIRKGSVVGANAVVTRDLPPYSVAAGIPARVIKKRLEFIPPKEIVFTNPLDLPYFYEGFLVSQEGIKLSKKYNGMVAAGDFKLSLATGEGKEIFLKIKSFSGAPAILKLGLQKQAIPEEWSVLSFSIEKTEDCLISFEVEEIKGRRHLISLEKAWIQ